MKKIPLWLFIPLWLLGLAGYLAMWTYGEIGTIENLAPNAPYIWAASLVVMVLLVAAFFKRIV